jgi:proline dehydrogenase
LINYIHIIFTEKITVDSLDNNSFIERVAYRLVKKHIAGKTMASALSKAKYMNSKGFEVSMSFLTQTSVNKAKINYISNTYMQLARQMSRMGIKGSIHIPMEQLGIENNEINAINNVNRIHATCKHYNILDYYDFDGFHPPINLSLSDAGIGFASFEKAAEYIKKSKSINNVKITLDSTKYGKEEMHKLKKNEKNFNIVKAKAKKLTVITSNKDLLNLFSKDKTNKDIMFEFRFGESEKMLSSLLKKRYKISVYMPFGKDWVSYAISKIPEGRMRSWASNLISKDETAQE